MTMKKLFAIALCVLLVLSFVGCSGSDDGKSTATTASTTSTSSTASSSSATSDSEEIVLRIIDYSDSSLAAREEFHKQFEERHPGVKIEYTCLTTGQYANTITTSIRSGDAPDLFPLPDGITLKMAVDENWYIPMDEYLTDEFVASIDQNLWEDGVTMLDGHIYLITETLPYIHTIIYYNQDVLDKAGITELPKTYSEFLDACVKVSEAGNGAFYGWIDGGRQLNRLEALVRAFVGKAGGKLGSSANALTVNGRANYDCQEVLDVFELFQTLVEEGGMHPDTISIEAPEAREMFAQGQAAFLMQGMWCIPTWSQTYPDMNYGVMDIPVPDSLADDPYRYGAPGASNAGWLGISSTCEHPELAAEYIMCLFSDEYDYQKTQMATGDCISIVTDIRENNMTNPLQIEYYDATIRNTRMLPVATKRDARVYDFYSEVHDVSPNLASIFQGVISQSIDDYESYLTTLSEQTTAEWKRACDAIGLDFSVFEFPNWDMSKDYSAEDYAELPPIE